jgi:hypothetical protein
MMIHQDDYWPEMPDQWSGNFREKWTINGTKVNMCRGGAAVISASKMAASMLKLAAAPATTPAGQAEGKSAGVYPDRVLESAGRLVNECRTVCGLASLAPPAARAPSADPAPPMPQALRGGDTAADSPIPTGRLWQRLSDSVRGESGRVDAGQAGLNHSMDKFRRALDLLAECRWSGPPAPLAAREGSGPVSTEDDRRYNTSSSDMISPRCQLGNEEPVSYDEYGRPSPPATDVKRDAHKEIRWPGSSFTTDSAADDD